MLRPSLKTQEILSQLRAHLRAKPGMYFGCAGSAAIPRMLDEVAIAVLQESRRTKRMTLHVEIGESDAQTIRLRFNGVSCPSLASANLANWLNGRDRLGSDLAYAMAAAERCTLTVSTTRRCWEVRWSDKQAFQFHRITKQAEPGIALQLRLHQPTFGRMTVTDLHRLCAKLRDVSILCPSLAVSIRAARPAMQLAYCYPDGLRSFVAEMDHSRWPLHPESLHFGAEKRGMKVEGSLRFVHAGIPDVRSWVNFHPSHGGVHLEGFGDALVRLLPDAGLGCRRIRFTTNPDTDAHVMLPHPFVAAIHVKMDDPKFAGPTKDILIGDEVRHFVHQAAMTALPRQWQELRERRS